MRLQCPKCGHEDFLTSDTRQRDVGISRRRECKNCTAAFRTVEISQREYNLLSNWWNDTRELLARLSDALHKASK